MRERRIRIKVATANWRLVKSFFSTLWFHKIFSFIRKTGNQACPDIQSHFKTCPIWLLWFDKFFAIFRVIQKKIILITQNFKNCRGFGPLLVLLFSRNVNPLDQTCPNWIKHVQIGSDFLISIGINNTLKNNAHSSQTFSLV